MDIFEEHEKNLGFTWKLDGVIQYFEFTVLPFGLATACYAFTKLMRPVVRYWRGKELRTIVYVDDGIVAIKGKDKAVAASQQVQKDLLLAGWVVSVKKSQWEPDRSIRWFGFGLDLEQGHTLEYIGMKWWLEGVFAFS